MTNDSNKGHNTTTDMTSGVTLWFNYCIFRCLLRFRNVFQSFNNYRKDDIDPGG